MPHIVFRWVPYKPYDVHLLGNQRATKGLWSQRRVQNFRGGGHLQKCTVLNPRLSGFLKSKVSLMCSNLCSLSGSSTYIGYSNICTHLWYFVLFLLLIIVFMCVGGRGRVGVRVGGRIGGSWVPLFRLIWLVTRTRTRVRLESHFWWLGLGLESWLTMTRTRTRTRPFGLGLGTRTRCLWLGTRRTNFQYSLFTK